MRTTQVVGGKPGGRRGSGRGASAFVCPCLILGGEGGVSGGRAGMEDSGRESPGSCTMRAEDQPGALAA